MRKVSVVLSLALMLAIAACQQVGDSLWFAGDFEAAMAAAKARDTHILLDFYSHT
jgi:hypothetical protein